MCRYFVSSYLYTNSTRSALIKVIYWIEVLHIYLLWLFNFFLFCELCNKMEYSGHLEGMLDRDLRTTKTPVYIFTQKVREKFGFSENVTESFATSNPSSNHHYCHPSRTRSMIYFRWRKRCTFQHYFKSKYIFFNFVFKLTLDFFKKMSHVIFFI